VDRKNMVRATYVTGCRHNEIHQLGESVSPSGYDESTGGI
jgi:hypothetical protein